MNKNLVNFLILLKNAALAKKTVVKVRKIHAISVFLPILYTEGIIQSYSFYESDSNVTWICIHLRKYQNKVLAESIKILSLPSRIKTFTYTELSRIFLKNKVFVLSTSKGLLTFNECLKYKIGGIAIFSC